MLASSLQFLFTVSASASPEHFSAIGVSSDVHARCAQPPKSLIVIRMALSVLFVVIGLILLTVGAEGLVRAGSSLALRLGVTPLVVGLTIVALGTSSPELVVSGEAAFYGNSAIALGNVVGSNIGNIALILGIAAVVCPMKARAEVVQREMPVMIGVTLLLWVLLIDGQLGRIDGFILFAASFAYIFFVYSVARRNKSREVADEFAEAVDHTARPVWLEIVMLVGGLALLVGGAKLLIDGALAIAAYFKVSEVIIGLTVVAIGTSLPELATSVVAAFKKESDVALGNAIGSNILNILFVLGFTAIIQPISAAEIKLRDLSVMLGYAVLLFVMLRLRSTLDRAGATVLLGGYLVYIYSLLP
jgi:cation:H+ antiporter